MMRRCDKSIFNGVCDREVGGYSEVGGNRGHEHSS